MRKLSYCSNNAGKSIDDERQLQDYFDGGRFHVVKRLVPVAEESVPVQEEVEQLGQQGPQEEEFEGLRLSRTRPEKKPFPYKQTMAGIGVGAAVTAAAIGAAYAGLKWYQKKRIRRVIAKHDLKLTDFSQTQKDAMAVAVLASRKVPGSMLRLGKIVRRGKLGSATISTEQMWTILADLYYRKTATTRDVQILQKRLAQ